MSYIKSKISNFKIMLVYLSIIILLTLFATYKNGIILYQKNLISFIAIFKILFLVLLAIIIPLIIDYIYFKYIKKEKYDFKNDYNLIFMPLIILALPYNINAIIMIVLIIGLSIVKLFFTFKNINYYSLIKILIMLVIFLIGKYSYLTVYDLNIETNFSTLDIFLGRSVGGIATTNILLLIICYIILSLLNKTYKREIPIIAFATYFITLIINSLLFKENVIFNIKELISSEFIYAIILVATISFYSPINSRERIFYAILIGILSFIFNKLINIYEGVFIAIIITNIIIYIYQKIREGIKHEHPRVRL